METGEDLNLMVPQAEKQTVRKLVKGRAIRGPANGGELQRIVGQPGQQNLELVKKTRRQPLTVVAVPACCPIEVRYCRRRQYNPHYG